MTDREVVEIAKQITSLEKEIEQIDKQVTLHEDSLRRLQTNRDIKDAKIKALLQQYAKQAVMA